MVTPQFYHSSGFLKMDLNTPPAHKAPKIAVPTAMAMMIVLVVIVHLFEEVMKTDLELV